MSEEMMSFGNFSFFEAQLQGAYIAETTGLGIATGILWKPIKKRDFFKQRPFRSITKRTTLLYSSTAFSTIRNKRAYRL